MKTITLCILLIYCLPQYLLSQNLVGGFTPANSITYDTDPDTEADEISSNYNLKTDIDVSSDTEDNIVLKGNSPVNTITVENGEDVTLTATTVLLSQLTIAVNAGGRLTIDGNLNVANLTTLTINGTFIVNGDISTSKSAINGGSADQGEGSLIFFNGSGSITVGEAFNAGTISDGNVSSSLSWTIDCGKFNSGGGSLSCADDLPVELLSFDVSSEDENVLIKWITAQEINNAYFEIRRSEDQKNWEQLGIIKAKGVNSNTTIHYQFIDQQPLAKSYYQLIQYDLDGTHENLSIVEYQFEDSNNLIFNVDILPNIIDSNQEFILNFNNNYSTLIWINIINIKGNLVDQFSINNENNLAVRLSKKYPKGTYILHARSGIHEVNSKFIVK
ncbi:hypothetical protein [Flammeovirga sp. SubArs3]|uniref:hypothetical protein n=1 Tax=Flammeovirga sp. SubArs3 TaxID=2995316 RepID=UPI00248B0B24|nr:hypothetical protein [Flammeovirga sp. SubArs3]